MAIGFKAAGESFFRSAEPHRGELVPAVTLEEFVPFAPGEAYWKDAGAEMPPEPARIEAPRRPKGGRRKRQGA